MTTATYDLQSLLDSADACAGAGDWAAVQQHLAQARILAPHDAGVATGLGISLLRLGRLPDALTEFQVAVQLAPNNAETYNNLGFACALNGQADAAEAAFLNALEQDPENGAATRNLAQLYLDLDRLQEGVALLVSRVRSAPDDADALHLLGTCYEEVEDLESARALFRQAVSLRPTEAEFQTALARVAPTQPEAVLARPGLSDKLARLKANRQKPTAEPEVRPAPAVPAAEPAERRAAVAFFGTGEVSDTTRLTIPANTLADLRHRVKLSRTPDAEDFDTFEVFVFSRPHLSGELLHAFRRARTQGKTVIVDVDTDYFNMPADHPRRGYLASREALAGLEMVLAQADLVTVPSAHLAQALKPRCERTAIMPSGWTPTLKWWTTPAPTHSGFVLGWVGDPSQDLDLADIHDAVYTVLRSRPELHLAVAGSPGAYQAFDDVSESRKLFLPMVGAEDFPYLLAHFDVLLNPVRPSSWSALGSAQRLMEAGARGLAWLASPAPALTEWSAGGAFCSTTSEWVAAIERLIDDDAWRESLCRAGREQAQSRRAEAIGRLWQAAISGLLSGIRD